MCHLREGMTMPVKIGGSYVSEAAMEFANAKRKEREEGTAKTKGGVLEDLKEKFSGLKITVGTGPFSGSGTNNLSISPKILREMETDPDKRAEYEALIYDIANLPESGWANGRKVRSHGVIIDGDGGLRGWSISETDDGARRNLTPLKRKEKKDWFSQMLGNRSSKKKSAQKEAQEKLEERRKEAARVEISMEGKEIATGQRAAKPLFQDVNDLSQYLMQNFNVVKGGMTKISSKYLRDCVNSEEKQQALFDTLAAADASYREKQGEVGFQGMRISIDENGEVTAESTKSTVSINEEKRRRQIAAAATKGDMQTVIALLEQDLQQLEDGLKQNMCDEAEVAKARKLQEMAKERMAKLPDRASTPAEQSVMSVNMLI